MESQYTGELSELSQQSDVSHPTSDRAAPSVVDYIS